MDTPVPALQPYHLQEIALRLQRVAGPALQARDIPSIAKTFRHLTDEPRESLYGLYLNPTNQIVAFERVSMGTILSTDAEPAEIARTALLVGASGVILLHNHPAGNPAPSPDDHDITQQVVTALHLFGIPLYDHLILAPQDQFFSFYAAGELPLPQPLAPAHTTYALTWRDPNASEEPLLTHAALTPRQASALAHHLHDLAAAGKIVHPAIEPLRTRALSCKALLRQHPILRSASAPQLPLEPLPSPSALRR